MFDVFYQGPKPNLFPFELPADTLEEAAKLSRTKFFWFVDGQNDYSGFDFDYRSAPWEEHQIHTWANQWQQDGGTCFANKYTIQDQIYNYHVDTYAHRLPNLEYWEYNDCQPNSIDNRWAPDPMDPPYIYQFPVKWGREQVDGPCYVVPGATEIKYLYDFVAEFNPQIERWEVPEEINADDIDFTWRADPTHPAYIYHFSSEFQVSSGLTYTAPGATDIKFLDMMPTKTGNAIQVLDIFFVNQNNTMSNKRLLELQERYPHVQAIRFANTLMDTIKRCVTRSKTNKFWVVSSENVYTDFNFEWHPEPWQGHMTHVFGSQWQKWSDTFLINRSEFNRCSEWCTKLEEFPNLNFVKDQPVYVPDDLHDIYYVDHGNDDDSSLKRIQDRFNKVKVTRYVNTYLDTFKRIMATATTEYVWIISSLCDYTRFDFSWQSEPWQKEMIHVFPSGEQVRGDTFYIHVESFKKQMDELELLDWFNVINYCDEQRVLRWPIPIQQYDNDNLITAIKDHNFKHPYAWFCNQNRSVVYNPSLWGEKDKKIVTFSAGNSYVLVPREAKNYIDTQVYDYEYIEKLRMFNEPNLDIIYISNGESNAEEMYKHLVNVTGKEIKRVQNINGRDNAFKIAAEMSSTPWFFKIPAKLKINEKFNWEWQPDYLQGPKHYIFHAKNLVTGLEYGHMAMVAYNKRLVLDTELQGLDFTLSQPHDVIPLLSGTAYYNADPLMTWRTAFREVIKLKDDLVKNDSIESEYRLHIWLTVATGDYAEFSIMGAKDAIEYYAKVNGEYTELMRSFDWDWLKEYWATKKKIL